MAARFRRDQLRMKHQFYPMGTSGIGRVDDVQQTLSNRDVPPDHPVDGPARQEFRSAHGTITREVRESPLPVGSRAKSTLLRPAQRDRRLDPLGDLEEMQSWPSAHSLIHPERFCTRLSLQDGVLRTIPGEGPSLGMRRPWTMVPPTVPGQRPGHRRRHKRSAARMSRIVSVVAADSWRLTCHEYEGRAWLDMQRARDGVHPGRLVYDPVVADREVPAPCLTQPAYGYGGACWSRQTAVPPGLSGAPDGRRPAHRTAHGATGPPTDRRRRGRARCPVVRRRRGS